MRLSGLSSLLCLVCLHGREPLKLGVRSSAVKTLFRLVFKVTCISTFGKDFHHFIIAMGQCPFFGCSPFLDFFLKGYRLLNIIKAFIPTKASPQAFFYIDNFCFSLIDVPQNVLKGHW